MLRITRITESERDTLLKLEGRLIGLWVEELSRVCAESLSETIRLRLDLAAVTFADDAGIRLLQSYRARRVQLVACSGLIAELLRRGNS